MKIIELLNRIADDEEIPKKIMYDDVIYTYDEYHTYYDDKGNVLWSDYNFLILNDEVKIIEEPKKIKKIKSNGDEFYSDYIDAWISKKKTDAYCEFLMNKINELIDEINNLKEK